MNFDIEVLFFAHLAALETIYHIQSAVTFFVTTKVDLPVALAAFEPLSDKECKIYGNSTAFLLFIINARQCSRRHLSVLFLSKAQRKTTAAD